MRTVALALIVGSVATLATLAPTHAAPAFVPDAPRIAEPTIQPVWYDRWGRWHPPHYYGYGYGYGPPRHYGYWHHRRWECIHWGRC
jgi:hypothetical protein